METVTSKTQYSTFENYCKDNVKKNEDKDLYGHITQVMSHLVRHTHPSHCLNKFEEVSHLMKNPEKAEQFLLTKQNREYAKPSDEALKECTQVVIKEASKHFVVPEVKLNEENQEEEAKPEVVPIAHLPDLRSDAIVYEWAGVCFGEYDTMLLQKSLQKHVVASGASQMRLWGKITGTQKDYYIAEGTLEAAGGEEGAEEPVEGMEPRGTGVNKFVYWACNGPLGEWTVLPDLKPVDINNARAIKYNFSGNLDQKIFTNPFYFESEKAYLRAQIARISFSTTLVPKGLYRFQEENDREIEDNLPEEGDLVKPSVKEMAWMDMWLHHTPSVLQ